MSCRCRICGKSYPDLTSLLKGTHLVNDVYGIARAAKCIKDEVFLSPDGAGVLNSEVLDEARLINPISDGQWRCAIEADLDNVSYLYDDAYYGQYMRPSDPGSGLNWRDMPSGEGLSVRYAKDVGCLNSEDSKYRHAYNRAYFGVRPEALRLPRHGVDALVTMTHWAYVDGRFSAGEVQVWIGEKGRGIDPVADVPAIVIHGEGDGDKCGIDVRSAGDFNGDGYEELLISAPFHPTVRESGEINVDGGVVYMVFVGMLDLRQRPLRIRAQDIGVTVPGIRFEGGHDGCRYPGWGLSMDRCHFSSKEVSSIVIGSFDIYPWKRRQEGRSAPAFPPRAYVIHGNRQLPECTGRYRLGLDDGLHGLRCTRVDLSDLPLVVGGMNMTMLGIGDLDGDGYEELAVTQSDGERGSSYIFYGGPERLEQAAQSLASADLVVNTGAPLALADGCSLEFRGLFSATLVNDMDGDGKNEVAFTAPKTLWKDAGRRTQVGGVGVLRGGERRYGVMEFSELDYIIHGEPGRTSALGKQNSVRSVDITNNGYADLLLNDTAYAEECGGRRVERGRFWLIEGHAGLPRVISVPSDAKIVYLPDLRVPGLFGYGWAVGDFDGDGRHEVAIGDHYLGYQNGKRAVGGVYLFPPEAGTPSRENVGRGSGFPGEIRVLSATASEVAQDLKCAGASANGTTALVIDTRAPLPAGMSPPVDFLDYLARANGHATSEIRIGQSVHKYGELVEGAFQVLVGPRGANGGPQKGLADWVVRNVGGERPEQEHCSKKELLYFLCSSSQRARLIVYILQNMLGSSRVACLVDHGAAIGMLTLCAKAAFEGTIEHIECSEVSERFVAVGTELSAEVYPEGSIRYQNCSAVDFVYPERTTVVFFGQMLFRIPEAQRQGLIDSAWHALAPGGLLIINEIMNRTDALASESLLTSEELISYLPRDVEQWLVWDVAEPKVLELATAERVRFSQSDNFVVIKRPTATKSVYQVLSASMVDLDYGEILRNGSGSDRVYLEKKSNMDGIRDAFIDYIVKVRTDLDKGRGTLLDSGCGNGRFSQALAQWYEVTGEDISKGGIYMALEAARQSKRNIQYRLADSLMLADRFDTVFLRGPSYLEGNQVSSEAFRSALQHMVGRCRRKLVYVSFSPSPFNVKNKFGCWSHDPDQVKDAFEEYGSVDMSYEDGYIVVSLTRVGD
jgi:2-polyprenyl-3-methyl-5-hydroxy-6-metoxy-1,4-benzoquinol methylase